MAIPTSDNFNRTAEDPLGNSTWETIDGGGMETTGTLCKAQAFASTDDASGWLESVDNFNDNQYSEVELVTLQLFNGIGPAVRMTAASGGNYYKVAVHTTTLTQLLKCINGTVTQIGSNYTTAISATAVIRLEAVGTTLTVYEDGVQIIQETGQADHTTGQPGVAGQDGGSSGGSFDNWAADNVVTPLISVSPATIVDGGTGYNLETSDMAPLTSIKVRSKQNNNHIVSLSFTGASTPYTVSAPNFKANTNETGIDGCPFTTTYDTLEFIVDDGTDTALADVIFNPASGYDEVKTSNTPSVASGSIAFGWQGFYEDITAVSITGTPTTLTVPTTGMVAGQEATISLLATTPDDANGEYITTIVNSTSITIAANVTAQTDQAGKWLTGYADEHGQAIFITTDCTINAHMEIFHSKTSDFYVQWFDYATSQIKAIPITASTGGGAGSTSLGLSISLSL